MPDDEDDFLSRIYEAGALPELWPQLLERFDAVSGSAGSVILALREGEAKWVASPGLAEVVEGYVARGYVGHDKRTERLLGTEHQGFLTETDVFAPGEWQANPIRRAFWEPLGYGWGVATHMAVPNGDRLIIHGERRLADGPAGRDLLDRLDRLRPHLARAMLLSNRLSFERSQSMVAALELAGLPAAVLDGKGQAIAANARLDGLTPGVVQARVARLGFANAAADGLLEAAITGEREAERGRVLSIPIPGGEEGPPMVAHLHPLRGAARDLFSRAQTVLILTAVGEGGVPSEAVIRGLFDLTPAEARVARGLAAGQTLNQIAVANGTSITTVRNQVRSVFAKTGTRRQAEFVGLVRGLGPAG